MREIALFMGIAVSLVIVSIFTTLVNQLTGPLVGITLHLIPALIVAIGLVLLLALRRIGGRFRVLIFAGSAILAVALDGVLVLINRLADSSRPSVHEVTLLSAKHQSMSLGRGGRPFDGTREMVVSSHRKGGGKISLRSEHFRGFHPIGGRVLLTIRAGALGFEWVEKIEPIQQTSPR